MANRDKNIAKFISKWQGRGREDEDDRSFWIDLLQDVFELTNVTDRLDFQKKVIGADGNKKRIDAYIPETQVLIEQKSLNIQLDKPQAGHNGKTPYEQAKEYDNWLPKSEKARWIVTSNFAEIWIYDMEAKRPEESIVKVSLANLAREYKQLYFLYDARIEQIKRELEISKEAGDEIGKIYDVLIKQYPTKPSDDDLRNLNTFCVRLVFCYYAEDAGLFDDDLFKNYISSFNPQHLRTGLKELFRILNTPESERDLFEEPSLLAFPYVNGGLFDGKNNVIPQFDEKTKKILIEAANFDWSDISPTIFGAIFESTLNQETRRNNGMHYTSIENIHKVIDPLFLNDLKAEFADIKASKQPNVRVQKLRAFQDKLASLTFLDPACGSGNFLTETYISLRKLENEAIKELTTNLMFTNGEDDTLIKVQLSQFNGFEINDFAVAVARTALWIAENQMMEQTKKLIVNADRLTFLPLKSFTNIREENALRIDWEDYIAPDNCNYIMGNPPFIGLTKRSDDQKTDMDIVFTDNPRAGRLDYVTAWFKKAACYMQNNPKIETAFVSTNSICQGEQAPILWKDMFDNSVVINFAYRTFKWQNEAQKQAGVSCVIIGFALFNRTQKYIFDGESKKEAKFINAYLVDAENMFIKLRSKVPTDRPKLTQGSKPWDGGNLILSLEEKNEMIKKYPISARFIRQFMGSDEYIKNKQRYCLWLTDTPATEYKDIPEIMQRLTEVRKVRLETKTIAVQKQADTPMLFSQNRQPKKDYLFIPETSSEGRKYIPIGFLDKNIIASNSSLVGEDATLFEFGLLTSNVHMAWVNTVAGRLETRYRYSPSVYNNFPFPKYSEDDKTRIIETSTRILQARELYKDVSLFDMYGENMWLYPQLLEAHRENDTAVMSAYGFSVDMTEAEIVAELMKMFKALTKSRA